MAPCLEQQSPLALTCRERSVTIMCRKSRYLTYTDRLIIEQMSLRDCSQRAIADMLGVSPSTISRELKRGVYERLDYATWKIYSAYSADIAQQQANYNSTAKGRPLALGNNHALAQYIEDEILSGKSPDVIIGTLARKGKRPFSTVTLYRYIHQGIFLRISTKNLLECSRRKRPYKKIAEAKRPPRGTSIEYRPTYIDTREEFGHWEMDCVIGKSKGKGQALLVMTERKTRYEIIYHLRDKTARSVVRALDNTLSKFPVNTFKTITVDNGSEFSDFYGMEHDKKGNRRTSVYYCHPYASCERGSNERMNRMIRRFFPKGQSLEKVTRQQCESAAAWLNNYPRRILDYFTPSELFQAEIEALQ